MTFSVEQKSQLAKLMATENLTVQHQNINTAKFDPVNRILFLPIWQNMTGHLYDYLTGHEVGHALYTPAEGWHTAATDTTKPRTYKNFLNVIEDARIEKKMKRRYPGLKNSFLKGFEHLFENNFFGIENLNVSKLPFIDRLNIYTKSQYTQGSIEFDKQESVFIEKVLALETWEDVVKLTDEIFEYSKKERNQSPQNFESDISVDDIEIDYDDQDGGLYANSQMPVDAEPSEDEADEDGESGQPGDEGNENEDEDNSVDAPRGYGDDSRASNAGEIEPECLTDEEFRNRETQLLDASSRSYLYVNLPKAKFENIITPYGRVIEQIEDYYFRSENDYVQSKLEVIKQSVHEFKNRNERFVSLLAKEFEMRKAAKAFNKSRICDTGDIDLNKLANYKFDDNIFRKIMLTPKGKSHGLVLLLDKSGSMYPNMPGSIEQILVLAMFCRKVNIPFVVYGFGDSSAVFELDRRKIIGKGQASFEWAECSLHFDNVFLREYMNSSMSNFEFNRAIRSLIALKRGFEDRMVGIPPSENLSGTPLTEAIFATGKIMNKFRRDNNLDLTSLVIVHDGDSKKIEKFIFKDDGSPNTPRPSHLGYVPTNEIRAGFFNIDRQNVIVQDAEYKFQHKLQRVSHYDPMLVCALEWFKKATGGSKIFGFFLTETGFQLRKSIRNRYTDEFGKHFEFKLRLARSERRYSDANLIEADLNYAIKKIKSEKFLACKSLGYDDFYIILGGNNLNIDDEDLQIEGNVTASKLKTAFMKFNKKRFVNRMLVSRFIKGIAA